MTTAHPVSVEAQLRVQQPNINTDAHAVSRPRLEHIDVLRGLCALAVVLVHAFEIYGLGLPDIGDGSGGLTSNAFHNVIRALYEWVFVLGALAVPVFITLSGYSLMIPVARSAGSMRTLQQLGTFFMRRVRRILPPYYAALILTLLLIALVPGMASPAGIYWDRALRDLEGLNILSHLLLVHNLTPEWSDGINPPFWSLAIEWQIYFLFPLLILLWRRLGLVLLSLLSFGYVALASLIAVPLLPFTQIHFVLLFVIGMAGASINFAPGGFELWLRRRVLWGPLALAAALLVLVLHLGPLIFDLPFPRGSLLNLTAGFAVTAFVIALTKDQQRGHVSPLGRLFRHPRLSGLGLFSYSLYLTHMPILALLALAARTLALSTTASYLVVLLAGPLLALALAYGFYLIFERPFLQSSAGPKLVLPAQSAPLSISGREQGIMSEASSRRP